MTKNEKIVNRNPKIQKKGENFWTQKFRDRHARYRISTPGARCNRLNFFSKYDYIYIKDFEFQILAKFGGGAIWPPPPQRFQPERSGMAPEWLKWTENKLF